MKTRSKTILVLFVTLLIGMILGAQLHSIWMWHNFRRMTFRMRTPDGFIERFERIIEPTEEQREAIRKVLKKHHGKLIRFQKDFPAMMDSLRKDMDSILTEEQKARLGDRLPFMGDPRFGPPFRKGWRGRGEKPPFMPDSSDIQK